MRTTITIDDELFADAEDLTGIKEKSALVDTALKALIEREAARKLARLGEPACLSLRRRRHKRLVRRVPPGREDSAPVRSQLLDESRVLMHGFVFGEVADGRPPPEGRNTAMAEPPPRLLSARDSEVLDLVDKVGLLAIGIGLHRRRYT